MDVADVYRDRVTELLSAETELDSELLYGCTEILHCAPPGDLPKAEIVAMLLKRETAKHGLTLSFVAPEIILSLVTQITIENGLSLMPDRIQRLLRKPLLQAVADDCKKLSLRIRSPQKPGTSHEKQLRPTGHHKSRIAVGDAC